MVGEDHPRPLVQPAYDLRNARAEHRPGLDRRSARRTPCAHSVGAGKQWQAQAWFERWGRRLPRGAESVIGETAPIGWPHLRAWRIRQPGGLVLSVGVALGMVLSWAGTVTVAQASGTPGDAYSALAPVRIKDTRTSSGPLGPGAVLTVPIAGHWDVPTTATAVSLNVTVTATTAASFLTVFPAGQPLPLASNLNWLPEETRANLVMVPVGSDGAVSFYNQLGQVQVVVDLQGYFSPSPTAGPGDYIPLPPSRIADTRTGSGEPDAGDAVGPGQILDIQVAGMGGVPSTGVGAADLNVTVTDPTAASYLTVYPAGEPTPLASNLNWTPELTVANRVMVPLGVDGQISVYNQSGTVQVVVDVAGYFSNAASTAANASLFSPISPTRVLDTRLDGGSLQPGADLSEQLAGLGPVSAQASAVVVNLTATDTSAASFFTLSPTAEAPTTSDLNWGPGVTVANLAVATLSSGGDVDLYNQQGWANAVMDVFGYFQPLTPAATSVPSPCAATDLTAPAQDYIATALAVTVSGSCPSGVTGYYTYWYRGPGTTYWTPAEVGSEATDYSYPTSGWTVGHYQLLAWASSEPGVYQQSMAGASTDMALPPCTGVVVSISPSPGLVSAPVMISAHAECPAIDVAHYAFFAGPAGGSEPQLLKGWTTTPSLLVGTQGWTAGEYSFTVWVSGLGSGDPQASAVAAEDLAGTGEILVSNVPYSAQAYPMDCEEAALEMALAHVGITLQGNGLQVQNDILAAEGVDQNVPGIGPDFTSGDPMQNFIGPPNGLESSAYEPGAYYGAVVKAAVHFGATVLAAGEGISPDQVYRYVEEGHPVQTWVTFNFEHYTPVWLSNGRNTWPWVGPHEHSVMVVGIGVNEVLVDNPWPTADYGAAYVGADHWVPMGVFESAYASFNDMAVVLN